MSKYEKVTKYLSKLADDRFNAEAEIRNDRPLDALGFLYEIEEWAEAAEFELVGIARKSGCSWAEIGAQMSMTRQAAWERYHLHFPE